MTALSPLLNRPLMFFSRSSEKTSHDPPPGLLAVPLTDRVAVGAAVAMPTLPSTTSPLVGTVTDELKSEPIVIFPETSNLWLALVKPMPTLPLAAMSIELVGAPRRMRKGNWQPPV